ncbi:hypothetical protein HO173_006786 [Letharia columbiana]|uniref:Uncharacterized protein n=1 Tax=Letharia columbiana TaxID=112416 RepID=A0A8H6FUR0_9LECA|nr:uncharacterized protein HO173_006786 [Letharia columbiana]KAF6235157.1 hypothetical protein HO173_006786 [Letharia columbiana]
MLTHRPVWKAFETLAVRYSQVRTHSWPKQGPSPLTVDQVTYIFLAKILTTFPIVFVDYGLENPDAKGFHTRRPWDGNFEPGHQQISINGKRTDHMSIAFGKASQTNNHHPFQAFLFMTANTLLHELGHVFVTYLTKGQSASPPQVNAVTEGVQGGEGEAGLALESLIFGGTIAYFQEPVSGTPDDQCGTAFLKKPSGAWHRILPKTIHDVASMQFKFPYDHDVRSTEPGQLRALGHGLAPPSYTDPLERSEVRYLLERHLPLLWSALHCAPCDSTLRAPVAGGKES